MDIKYIDNLSLENKLNFFNFFIQNSHLKEMEFFFFWKMSPNMLSISKNYPTQKTMLDYIANHRKQKSVKKALYQSYLKAVNDKKYYPFCDFMFCRCFEDINFLVKLLSIINSTKNKLVSEEMMGITISFIYFLKEHYSEKQISNLFLKDIYFYHPYVKLWQDTILMVENKENLAYIKQHFQKVKLTVRNLHDELVDIFNQKKYEEEEKVVFKYEKNQLQAEKVVDKLEFKLPKNAANLHKWAKTLHNCVFSYAKDIESKKTIIYGLFKDDKLIYAIELKNMQIVQALGVYNSQIEDGRDIETIKKWYLKYNKA